MKYNQLPCQKQGVSLMLPPHGTRDLNSQEKLEFWISCPLWVYSLFMALISCYLSMLSPSCYLSMCFFVHVCLPEAPRGRLFLSCSPSASPGFEQSLTPRSLQSTCSESRGSKCWAGWWNLVVVGMFCILTVSAFWLWYWTVVFEMLPLREMEWGSICIISYNCMWIYNDFKKKFNFKNLMKI